MGVWIETGIYAQFGSQINVTPFVGVWIETIKSDLQLRIQCVTPFVGVWIETRYESV